MKMLLLHGRENPEQDMEDWGYSLDLIEGVKYVHETYRTIFTVGFHSVREARRAAELTGWAFCDNRVLEVSIFQDLICAAGAYFGDWELME